MHLWRRRPQKQRLESDPRANTIKFIEAMNGNLPPEERWIFAVLKLFKHGERLAQAGYNTEEALQVLKEMYQITTKGDLFEDHPTLRAEMEQNHLATTDGNLIVAAKTPAEFTLARLEASLYETPEGAEIYRDEFRAER